MPSATSSTSARRSTASGPSSTTSTRIGGRRCGSSTTTTGALVGAALAEWSAESGRAWLLGPWVDGSDADWARWARPLLDAVAAQVPASIVDREMSGALANERLAALAAELGWPPTETNHAYVLDAAVAAAWTPSPTATTCAAPGPTTCRRSRHCTRPSSRRRTSRRRSSSSGPQPASRSCSSPTDEDASFAGYAAGRVQPDGEGYIDFVAVDPARRGSGAGRRLVVGLATRLLPATTTGRIHLTVQDHRAPARALYSALGFRLDASVPGLSHPDLTVSPLAAAGRGPTGGSCRGSSARDRRPCARRTAASPGG